jgi:5,10-methenyltetrahydrofolate synthetase
VTPLPPTWPEAEPQSTDWPEIKAWRRAARSKLLGARAAIAAPVRAALAQRLAARLTVLLQGKPQPISFYWPIKAEPDLRPLMRELDAAGVAICLPVATRLGEPLRFRPWRKGVAMERGLWDIPVPATADEVRPRTLIAPVVGYDGLSYRLGYGGGFFDRTLAAYGDEAQAIGIGYTMFRLATIQPQPHDVRMSAIVTESDAFIRDEVRPASEVCYLSEAEAAYAGFDTAAETSAKLAALRPQLPPERVALVDYTLWRLGPGDAAGTGSEASPQAVLDAMLPRIRDDSIHAAITALKSSLTASR